MSEYIYTAHVFVTHNGDSTKKAMANALAQACTDIPNYTYRDQDWEKYNSDTIWGFCVWATINFKSIIDVFNANGYPQQLLDAGMSEAQIDFARTFINVGYIESAHDLSGYDAYVASNSLILDPMIDPAEQ